jgi:hypothetical protein
MLSEPQCEYLRKNLPTTQIIIGALAAGVFTFIGRLPFFAAPRGDRGPDEPLLLVYIGWGRGLAVAVFFAWAIVPRLIAGHMRQAIADGQPLETEVGDVRPLVNMYQTRLIIGAAILEGAAFFNVVAYMLEHQPISLVVAGLLALTLLAQIPTFGRLRNWAEDDLATIKQLRAMGSHHAR